MRLLRKKPPQIDTTVDACFSLAPTLTAVDLIFLGIGAIIGAGVFVLTGIAAATKAGPAVSVSYAVASLAALFAALCYAELATSVGGCGSAYTYAYTGFGEIFAWLIGWDLIFEYALCVASVAIGWSGYVNTGLLALHIHLPTAFLATPEEGGICNLPAALIVLALGVLLYLGVKQSARFNAAIVIVKLFAIAVFMIFAVLHVDPIHWQPFFPFGWQGVMQGAALVFFAYIGFDALSTAVEETIRPQRNIPIGILVSVVICTLIYVIVATLLTGIVPYTSLNVKSPVADALFFLGEHFAAGIIAAGAIAGLTTVMLVMYYGLTRIIVAIARDDLLPKALARIHPVRKTPGLAILVSGFPIAIIAAIIPLKDTAALVNIGTLTAFSMVCLGTIWLRWTQPNLNRPFKLPLSPLLPLLGLFFCVYLLVHLPSTSWLRFIYWLIIGLFIYFWRYRFLTQR